MKIERHYKPELVASKKPDRYALCDPYLDVAEERLVATDGYRLVAVPVEVEKGEVSGYVSRELLQVGRRKAEKLSPVEIKDRVDLLPHRIEWPVDNSRTFPNWKAVLPTYRQGDAGTITIGLNSRLLKGIADALGSEGMVALTVKVDEVGSAPIVVRAIGGDPGEVGILMPCRVDKATGRAAAPAPVVDLAPTEAEKRKAAEEAGEDPDEPESMDLPGVPGAVPPNAVLAWAPSTPGLQLAAVPTGRYLLRKLDNGGHSATWAPWKGREKSIVFGVPEEEAKDACARHNVERIADAILANSGSGDLVKNDTKGAAVARKKGGRRG